MAGIVKARKIPKKVVRTGDVDYAEKFLGVADSQLVLLEEELALNTNPNITDLSSTRKYDNGRVVIEAWICSNLSGVRIHAFGEDGKNVEKKPECFCSCNISIGFIRNLEKKTFFYDGDDTVYCGCYDYLRPFGEEILYMVQICRGKNRVVYIENCPSSDFSQFVVNEQVVVLWKPLEGQTYRLNGNGCAIESCTVLPITPFEKPEVKYR